MTDDHRATPGPEDDAGRGATSLQDEIGPWVLDMIAGVIGRAPERAAQLAKLVGEVGELVRADAEDFDTITIADEAADVFICLLAYATRMGFDLEAVTRMKHEVNKQRAWAKNADGTISHVKE